MNRRIFSTTALLLLWGGLVAQPSAPPALPNAEIGLQLLRGAKSRLDAMQTASGTCKRLERVNGEMEEGQLRFKICTKPRKIYIYNINPNEGTELLYVDGWNDGKIYIHPNQFPWVNLSMDVNGGQMLDDQHHHVFSTGFVTGHTALRSIFRQPTDLLLGEVVYQGKQKWYGKMVDVVKVVHDDYKIVNYTVAAGEDLLKIDHKLHVPSYKLLELNPECDDYFDVKAGQVIKVPNHFAKESVFMIDPDTQLPIVQIYMDDKGLFEKYEYSNVKLNPSFGGKDFSTDNEEYGF